MNRSHDGTLRRVASSAARANLADLLEAVGDRRERVLIERRGKPPVAMISADDLLQFQLLEARLRREAAGTRKPT